MNVVLPEKHKLKKRTIALYTIAILVCIFAIIVVVGFEILGENVVNNLFGINKLLNKSEEEEANLKANFNNIFQNTLTNANNIEVSKVDNEKEIVETQYSKQEENEKYNINVNIPYININSEIVKEYNKAITNAFQTKAEEILKNEKSKSIYTVKYQASVEKDILSIVIYTDLKQGTEAQKVSIMTINYDIKNDRKVDLEDVIGIYGFNKSSVQSKINNEIKDEYKKSEDLKNAGYNVFSRDLNSDIYLIKNSNEFFVYEGNIYIIYAYGNNSATTEMDMVII